ncbi:MAG TPA: DinB family protein [Candidatus Limnocylindria bacterium]
MSARSAEAPGIDHRAANDASRERMRTAIGRIGGDGLRREVPGGWTAAALLAHLGFWDRLTLARWKQRLGSGPPLMTLDDRLADVLNDAGLPAWRALEPEEAVRQALEAAEAVDALVAGLPGALVSEAHAQGASRLVDRSLHRGEHLAQLERPIGSPAEGGMADR